MSGRSEVLVTLGMLLLLLGVVNLGAQGVVDRERLRGIVELVADLEEACQRYHADTGKLAYEYTGYEKPHRKLSARQALAGWSGPYLERPFTHHRTNPFGSLHVYNDPRANRWIEGFDLDGDGSFEVGANANMLWLSGIDDAHAAALDRTFDRGVEGAWRRSGRLRSDPDEGFVWVLLHR